MWRLLPAAARWVGLGSPGVPCALRPSHSFFTRVVLTSHLAGGWESASHVRGWGGRSGRSSPLPVLTAVDPPERDPSEPTEKVVEPQQRRGHGWENPCISQGVQSRGNFPRWTRGRILLCSGFFSSCRICAGSQRP